MKIAILTAQEPFYLPHFLDRFLARRVKDVVGIFPCKPVYIHQTMGSMLRRYVRTFGVLNAVRLAWRVLGNKVGCALGVGKNAYLRSVEGVAAHYGVAAMVPHDVNDPAFHDHLRQLGVDVILSVSCPQIFKDDLIRLPAKGCLNIHGADLPNYRGIMPSFWMMAKGETEAAVTVFFVNAGIDTGDMAGKRRFAILPEDTLDSFVHRAKREACDLSLGVLEMIEAGTVTRQPLPKGGSYFGWPGREAYREFRSRGRKLW